MRLFLAIPLSEPHQKVLANLMGALREVKGTFGSFSKATNLHLTVYFFGEVPEERLPILQAALTAAAEHWQEIPPFVLEALGAFPTLHNPRMIWAGGIISKEFGDFVTSVRETCDAAGIPGDNKPFQAHITLMRIREVTNTKLFHADLMKIRVVPQKIPVNQIVLFKSDLNSYGPTYTALSSWKIGRKAI